MTIHTQTALIVADIISATAILGSLSGLLPPAAAIAALCWYGFLIYDRIRYGPELANRTKWWNSQKRTPPDETL